MKPKTRMLALGIALLSGVLSAARCGAPPQAQGPAIAFELSEGLSAPLTQSWGASWGDYDGDGLPDLYVVNHAYPLGASLYHNEGDGTFSDASHLVLAAQGDRHGATWADFDNDGDQDLIQVTGGGNGNQLLVNMGDTFVEAAALYGLDYPGHRGRHGTWLDWNVDGLLDAFLVGWPGTEEQGPTTVFTQDALGFLDDGAALGVGPGEKPLFAQLLRFGPDARLLALVHDRDYPGAAFDLESESFENLVPLTIPRLNSKVVDVGVADFDGDLRSDLYLARASHLSEAYQPQSNKLHARIVSTDKGLAFQSPGTLTISIWGGLGPDDIHIGSAGIHPASLFFILDGDDPGVQGAPPAGVSGLAIAYDEVTASWSIVVTGPLAEPISLVVAGSQDITEVETLGFINGAGKLGDRLLFQTTSGFRTELGGDVRVPSDCASVAVADLDNDMDVDVVAVCGIGVFNAPDIVYANDGSGWFTRIEGSGIEVVEQGRGDAAALADFDLDGFIDVVITNGYLDKPFNTGPVRLYRNRGNQNHWIQLDLVGTVSNRDAVGARVVLTAGGVAQLREQAGGIHRSAQDFQRLHFGLGDNTAVESIEIEWPSGIVQTLTDVAVDQVLEIVEPLPPVPLDSAEDLAAWSFDASVTATVEAGPEQGMPTEGAGFVAARRARVLSDTSALLDLGAPRDFTGRTFSFDLQVDGQTWGFMSRTGRTLEVRLVDANGYTHTKRFATVDFPGGGPDVLLAPAVEVGDASDLGSGGSLDPEFDAAAVVTAALVQYGIGQTWRLDNFRLLGE